MNPKIIIIGAGASGYAAACRLLEKGFTNITILEAGSRIGGRIHSIPFGESKVDLGAQWCHGEKGNVVYEMVEKLNLLQQSFHSYSEYLFVDVRGNYVNSDVSAKLTDIAFEIVENKDDMKAYKGSFGNYFIERYNEKIKNESIDENTAKKVKDWFQKFLNSINASSTWFEVSSPGLTHYKECEGDLTLQWKGQGYETIFSIMKKKIPDPTLELPIDDCIQFNKPVSQIHWGNQNGVRVSCQDGSSYNCDHVIFTPSLGFLKENHESLFIPELPAAKKNAILGLGIGTVNKIMLKFEERWWPSDSKGFSFIWGEQDLSEWEIEQIGGPTTDGKSWVESVFGFYPIEYNPNVLMGWVTGPLGPQIEQLSDEIVTAGCLFLLKKFLGQHYKISAVESVLRSSWYTNPYIRGSYSFRSLETELRDTSAADLAAPLIVAGKETVLFAGEATHDHFYSTVHGAIESGYREAERIVDMYKSGRVFKCSL